MIITVKNLKQQTFTIEFEREKTVLELKEKIFKERGPEYVVEKQKLIYAGVVLEDERTIASYNVNEKKFVVVMLKRDLGGGSTAPPPAPSQKSEETGGATVTASGASYDSSSSLTSVSSDSECQQSSSSAATEIPMTTAAGGERKIAPEGDADVDTKSVGSGGSDSSGGGGNLGLGQVGSNTSILSSASGLSLLSGSSVGSSSSSSETSHSTYSSGDLAGVFSNTSLQSRAESNLLMGEEYNRSVESMIEMGYAREMVERAMAASFNNPERAVEYLISGIPEESENAFTAAAAAAVTAAAAADAMATDNNADNIHVGAGDAVGAGGDGVLGNRPSVAGDGAPIAATNRSAAGEGDADAHFYGAFGETTPAAVAAAAAAANADVGSAALAAASSTDPFEFLRNQPQFLQMRSLVYQNPDLLHAVLQQIGQTNPALLQLISENQDAFLSMLNQPMEGQPMEGQTGGPQYPRRMTPGRRAQLAAAARAAAGGDGLHVRALDNAPGAGGDGPPPPARQRPGESGDAGADTIPHDMLPARPDRAAERRAAAADAFMRERAAAAAAVAALTAAASAAVERDAGGGDGDNLMTAGSGGGGVVGGGGGAVVGADDNTGGGGVGGGGVATIRLTTQDQDAIERLKALGFPETLVLQAYFACEKDEQLAANFLISSAFDD